MSSTTNCFADRRILAGVTVTPHSVLTLPLVLSSSRKKENEQQQPRFPPLVQGKRTVQRVASSRRTDRGGQRRGKPGTMETLAALGACSAAHVPWIGRRCHRGTCPTQRHGVQSGLTQGNRGARCMRADGTVRQTSRADGKISRLTKIDRCSQWLTCSH